MLESLENRSLMVGDITGVVFADTNANGIDDPAENGLAGWTVFADTNHDGLFTPGEPNTVTDVKGKYALTGLPVASTTVYDIPQDGYSPTPGFTDHVTITVRDGRKVTADFPNRLPAATTGRVVGTVFEDDNENQTKDSGEHGLESWTMFLDTNNDGLLSSTDPTTTTNTDGDYAFNGVAPGTYNLYEVPQAGLAPIVGGLFPTQGASDHHSVTVVAGATTRSDFANLIPPIGTIQGTVWNDDDGDATRDASESALANRTIFVDLNANSTQDAGEPSRLTDVNGQYTFTGIHTGTYRVTEVRPDGWISAEGRPSSVNTTVFRNGVNTVDFFDLVPRDGSLSGTLWNDLDGNGLRGDAEPSLSGWQVYQDANNNGTLDAGERVASTDSDGLYTLSPLAYGTQTIREVVPAGWVSVAPAASSISVKLLNGENRTGVLFGNRENIGDIRGNVWNDANGDRTRAVSEGGLADWTVYLDLNLNSQQDDTELSTLTDATGAYSFSRLAVGNYQVTLVRQEGWIASEGSTSSTLSVLTIGSVNTVDFYNLVPVTGSVSGTVWSDLNSNGIQDPTESALAGSLVYADLNGNLTVDATEPQATSDASGLYTLAATPYGTTTIRTVIAPGYTATTPSARTTLLLNGENRLGMNFGIHEPSDFSITGIAFKDANENGTFDAGERGISGIPVYLDLNNNGVQDATEPSTSTSVDFFYTPDVNEAGTYAFTHLTRGTYTVREVVPTELDRTTAEARVHTVDVGAVSATNVDFANLYRLNEIHGIVFDDTNHNSAHDDGEYARPGISVYIDLDRDDIYDADEPHSVTDVDGSYSFTGLTPGAYIVREEPGSTAGPHTYPTTGGGTLMPGGVSHPSVGNVTPGSITTSLSNGEVYSQTVSLTLPDVGSLTNMVDVFLLFDDTGSFTGNSPIVRAAFPTIIDSLQASLPGTNLGFGVGRLEEYGNFAAEFANGRPFILNQPIVASSTPGFSSAIQSALDRMAPGYGGDAPETDIEALFQLVTGRGFDGNNNGTVSDSGPAGLSSTQLNPGASGDVPSFASFTADPINGVLAPDGNVGGGGFRAGALPIILLATDTGFAYQPKGETTIVGGGVSLPVSDLIVDSRASTPFGSGAGIQETITGLNALGALVIGLGTQSDPALAPRSSLEGISKLTGAVNRSISTIANGTPDAIAPGDPLYFQISSGFGATVADGVINAIQNAATNVAMDITVRASDPRVQIVNATGTLLGISAGQTASFDIQFTGDGRPHRFDLEFVRAGTNVVLGSIPVVLGTPMVGEGYSYDELEDGEIHRSSHFGNYVTNVAPTFTGGSDQTVAEDAGTQTVAGWASNLVAGPANESGQTLSFVVTNSQPSLFAVPPSISADGTLTFTPAPNAAGVADLTVVLKDNGGTGTDGADTSLPVTFSITITPSPDAPVAADDVFTLNGSTLTIDAASGVLVNDMDPDGDAITAQVATGPAHGTLTLNSDGSFAYAADAGFEGLDSFTYIASDTSLSSVAATVSITVRPSNATPVAIGEAFEVLEGQTLTVPAPGLLANDSDADGNPLTAVLVTGPANGSLELLADGSFVYTPATDFSGSDSFTYLANDGRADSAPVTVNVTVTPLNRAPVTVADSYAAVEDTTLTVPVASGLLANDSDANHDPLTASLVASAAHGTVTIQADGSFTYVPQANYFGTDSFTYSASDGTLSSTETVTLSVAAINDAPSAVNNTYNGVEDTLLSIATASGVLANDTDVDGDPLTATLMTPPTHGTLTLNADGSLSYQPAANYRGTDSFTYRTNDGLLDSNLATVTINLASVNDAPVAFAESFTATEDTPLSIVAPGLLSNDSDVDGDVLRAVRVTNPAHGTLSLNANGSFVYTPALNYNGPDSFTYQANDGFLSSAVTTVSLDVVAVNDAPVARADAYSTSVGVALSVPVVSGILANDTDAEGSPLTAALTTSPTHGTLALAANGSFVYTPEAGYIGPDSFTYTTSDGTLSSTAGTVSLTVTPPPTKFFVADADRSATFQYAADGSALNNRALNKANGKARGIASNANGTIQWVIDGGGTVYVYDNNAALLGQWQPQGVGKPEGITVWGNDLWLVDPTQDRVFRFTGGANVRSGRVNATSSFALNGANLNSTDLVTDGAHLWVVNDTLTGDRVFRYTTAGALEGSWALSTTNPSPTGITLDPTDVNHLWVVDASTDRIYQYDGATTRLAASQEPSRFYALAATNTNPQGIADPDPSWSAAADAALADLDYGDPRLCGLKGALEDHDN